MSSCIQSDQSVTSEKKMNVLKKLNLAESSKPYYGLSELSLGYHKISCFRISNGKFGRSVIAELKREIIFLPQYLTEKLEDKDVDELNSCEETVFLFFGGRHEKNR